MGSSVSASDFLTAVLATVAIILVCSSVETIYEPVLKHNGCGTQDVGESDLVIPGGGDIIADFEQEDKIEMANNPYWENICKIAEKQRAKGIDTYGGGIEMNPADIITRIEYLEEELVDALMYCEWIKDYIGRETK